MAVNLARVTLHTLFFAYAACVLVATSVACGPFALLLPSLQMRRVVVRLTVRLCLAMVGIRVHTAGLDRLPVGAAIVVANHCSYLDGPVLFAALPPRFAFVIKAEASRLPIAGLLLRRLRHEFVDRFNRHRGAVDARRILRLAASGQSIVFFPEGTISAGPGLGRFHTGAFVTAVRAGVPVAPIAIRGTGRILPADRWSPRPGRIDIEVLAPLTAAPEDDQPAATLRDAAHARIAAVVDGANTEAVLPG